MLVKSFDNAIQCASGMFEKTNGNCIREGSWKQELKIRGKQKNIHSIDNSTYTNIQRFNSRCLSGSTFAAVR